MRTGIYHNMTRDDNEFNTMFSDTTRPVYYFTIQQSVKTEDVMLAIGKLNYPVPGDTLKQKFSDKVLVSYYSPTKIFTVSFKIKDPDITKNAVFHINHIPGQVPGGHEVQLTIYNTSPDHTSTIFTILTPSIDVNSVIISDFVNPVNPVFYL
jgi:hypothetical protein